MIDLSNVPVGLKIAFVLAPFIISLTGVGIGYHRAGSRHFEVLCKALKKVRALWRTLRIGVLFRLEQGR